MEKVWFLFSYQRQAVQISSLTLHTIMDCSKIHDSQLPKRNLKSLLGFLSSSSSSSSTLKDSKKKFPSIKSQNRPSRISPQFCFKFKSFSIGQHVQYNVVLLEKYKILGRSMVNKYHFKTRYSMLEVLDRKLGGKGFPQKKYWGNKKPSFVEKRKAELQKYLNKVGRSKQIEFLRFVKQIKDCDFNRSLDETFTIE